jgi:hypothetical protein
MNYISFAELLKDNLEITGFGSKQAKKEFDAYIDAMVGKVTYNDFVKRKSNASALG